MKLHGQSHMVRVRNQPLCRGRFDFLESNRRLPNRVDATVEVVLARSQKCPPKLRPDLYNKGGHATITTLEQLPATSLKWRDCGVQNFVGSDQCSACNPSLCCVCKALLF